MEEKQNFVIPSEKSIRRTIIKKRSKNSPTKPTYHEDEQRKFIHYMSEIDFKLEGVTASQLQILRKKYRFYLSTIEQLEQKKSVLQERLLNFEQMIENSQTIIESDKNINFIEMILDQTKNKVAEIEQRVNIAKQNKKKSEEEIFTLKKQIKLQKDTYFDLKRQQLSINREIAEIHKQYERGLAENRFKQILASKFQITRNQSKKGTTFVSRNVLRISGNRDSELKQSNFKTLDQNTQNITPKTQKNHTEIKNNSNSKPRKATISIYGKKLGHNRFQQSELASQKNKVIQSTKQQPIEKSQNKSAQISKKKVTLLGIKQENVNQHKMILTSQIRAIQKMKQQMRELASKESISEKQISCNQKFYKKNMSQSGPDFRSQITNRKTKQAMKIKKSAHKAYKYALDGLTILKNKLQRNKIRLPQINNKNINKVLNNGSLSQDESVTDQHLLITESQLIKHTQEKQKIEEFMQKNELQIIKIIGKSGKIEQVIKIIQQEAYTSATNLIKNIR